MQVADDAVSPSEIRGRLAARRGQWPKISARAEVSYTSIVKFMRGTEVTPRVRTLQRLRSALDAMDVEPTPEPTPSGA